MTPLSTLADCKISDFPRCSGCGGEIPPRASVERFNDWIVAKCPKCKVLTPFRLEAA